MRTRPLFHRLPLLLAAFALAIALPLRAEDHAALGRAALAQADYPAAVEHLLAASRELEGGDRERLSQVQVDLGITYLTGLDRPADALRAFVRAADLAANPASAWLWASTAAMQMGDEGESERYKKLALGVRTVVMAPLAPPSPTAPPEPASPADPVPAPAQTPEVVEPAKAPETTAEPAPAPAPQKPSAFGHFVGGKGKTQEPAVAAEKVETPPAASKDKDLKDSKDNGKEGEASKPEALPAAKPGSAFDHFFKRKPADEPREPAASEPPPGRSGVAARP